MWFCIFVAHGSQTAKVLLRTHPYSSVPVRTSPFYTAHTLRSAPCALPASGLATAQRSGDGCYPPPARSALTASPRALEFAQGWSATQPCALEIQKAHGTHCTLCQSSDKSDKSDKSDILCPQYRHCTMCSASQWECALLFGESHAHGARGKPYFSPVTPFRPAC